MSPEVHALYITLLVTILLALLGAVWKFSSAFSRVETKLEPLVDIPVKVAALQATVEPLVAIPVKVAALEATLATLA